MTDYYVYPARWYVILGKDTITIGLFNNCISDFCGRKDYAVLGPFKSGSRAQLEAETFKND